MHTLGPINYTQKIIKNLGKNNDENVMVQICIVYRGKSNMFDFVDFEQPYWKTLLQMFISIVLAIKRERKRKS